MSKVIRHKEIDECGATDLVSIGSHEQITLTVVEDETMTTFRSEPRWDGNHELAVLVDTHARVFANGIEVA